MDRGRTIKVEPLSSRAFAEFGDVIDVGGDYTLINDGQCRRYSELAKLDFDPIGRAGISLFDANIRSLPYSFRLMERHPLGSQAFLPMEPSTFLVVVARDEKGVPGHPFAFETNPLQGVNYHRGIWHGVLTPLGGCGRFAVVDWTGEAVNLELHEFEHSYTVVQEV